MNKREIVIAGKVIFTLDLTKKRKCKAIGGNSVITSFPNRYIVGGSLNSLEVYSKVKGIFQ